MSEDRIRGRDFHKTVPLPQDRHRSRREFERIFATRTRGYFESRWKIRDSSPAEVACSCTHASDSGGNAEHIICTCVESLSHRLMSERVAELRAISRFVHDTISQHLAALSLTLSRVEGSSLIGPLQTEVESALGLVDRCCRDARVIGAMLAPPSLSDATLEASIEQLAAFVREETGISIVLDLDPVSGMMPPDAQLVLFAALQSWVGRAVRGRTQPGILLHLRGRRGEVIFRMEMAPPMPGLQEGWTILRARARALGGVLNITADSARAAAVIALPGLPEE